MVVELPSLMPVLELLVACRPSCCSHLRLSSLMNQSFPFVWRVFCFVDVHDRDRDEEPPVEIKVGLIEVIVNNNFCN